MLIDEVVLVFWVVLDTKRIGDHRVLQVRSIYFFENPWIQNPWISVSCPDLTGLVFAMDLKTGVKKIHFIFSIDSYRLIPWNFIERTLSLDKLE